MRVQPATNPIWPPAPSVDPLATAGIQPDGSRIVARVTSVSLLAWWMVFAVTAAWGQGVIRDGFEGPRASLRDAGGDAHHEIINHARTSQEAHSGQWAEQLTVRGNNGTFVYVEHPLAPARVISELVPSIWVKADRPGVQLLVRVVLPRSIDLQTGQPRTALLRGTSYERVGVWQQLRLEGLGPLLQRHVRVMRVQFGRDVDDREAYVDRILLNVYGGPGTTTVLVDDLEVEGVVSPQAVVSPVAHTAEPAAANVTPRDLPPAWAGGRSVPKVQRSGPLLLVDGQPFFARAVEYRGESPRLLKSLGFNAVWLTRGPTQQFLQDAAAAGLWVIAPPPPRSMLEAPEPGAGAGPIDNRLDGVLAWNLGRHLAASQLDETRDWARAVQAADQRGRPMICAADSELKAYARPPIHMLLADRNVLSSSLEFADYTRWLRQRSKLTLPGTIFWATIQTQPPVQLDQQMALLSGGRIRSAPLQESQVRTMVHAALAGGVRGLCFRSHTRLDANDQQTKRRAAILQLVNMELELIERWPATGNFATTADSSDPHANGAVIDTDRSRLLLPMYTPPNSQMVMGAASGAIVNFTVPGVPEEARANELSLVSFRPLDSKRVAGGTRVLLGELERDSLIVFTQDQRLVQALHQRLNRYGRRAAELTYQIAAEDQVAVEIVDQRLAALGRRLPETRSLRIVAQNDLREYQSSAASGDLPRAFYRARHALALVRVIQRAHFENIIGGETWPLGDPWTASASTLDEHVRFAAQLESAPRGPELVPNGLCEDLNRMIDAGWKHYRHPQPNVATAVDLAPQAAHSGQGGLLLRAAAAERNNPPSAVETAPMWVTTPPVPTRQGQIVEIRAWVRMPNPLGGSVDGLMIVDNLAGEALAQRVGPSGDWQEIAIYRAAPRDGTITVTFALTGLGEAWIDDVSVRTVSLGGTANQPQAAHQPAIRQPPPQRPVIQQPPPQQAGQAPAQVSGFRQGSP